TTAQICLSLDMTERSVQRILRFWRNLQAQIRDPKVLGRPRIMNDTEMQFLLALIKHSPDLYLDEIAEELYYMHGIEPGLSTIHETLRFLGFGDLKCLSKRAREKSVAKIFDYVMQAGAEEPDRLVFADETAVNVL
ncbi:hypothetical protein EXIGLDRAFT_577118, partial [Exidia glandulosa HHB12029]